MRMIRIAGADGKKSAWPTLVQRNRQSGYLLMTYWPTGAGARDAAAIRNVWNCSPIKRGSLPFELCSPVFQLLGRTLYFPNIIDCFSSNQIIRASGWSGFGFLDPRGPLRTPSSVRSSRKKYSKSPLKPYKSPKDHATPLIWNIPVQRMMSSIIRWWQIQRQRHNKFQQECANVYRQQA